MNTQGHETARAGEQVAGLLGLGAALGSELRISGFFDCMLHECKPQHRVEYLDLVGQLGHLNRAERTNARTARPAFAAELARQRRGIADIEKYLHSLTEPVKELHFPNTVLTAGKNFFLDNALAGSAYTATWFIGLISSTSFSAINVADTMASHAGWLEAGATNTPTYSGARKTAAWSAASGGSKALSAGLVFTFTGSGTVKGGFLTTVSTVDGTTGTAYSAGLFTGGDQPVVSTNTLTVSYTATLT